MGKVGQVRTAIAGVPFVLSPEFSRALQAFCKNALYYGDNHHILRKNIVTLNMLMVATAEEHFGHLPIESRMLHELLQRTVLNPDGPKKLDHRKPPIKELEDKQILDPGQLNAAHKIAGIWDAFGRFLQVSGRSYQKGGKRARIMQPLDVMDQETWELWKDVYVPWYDRAQKRHVTAPATPGSRKMSHAALVLNVVLGDHHPDILDRACLWEDGMALNALRAELDRFNDQGHTPQRKIL